MFAGTSASRLGNVIGSLPAGLASPNSSAATALPSSSPGYHACRIAGTLSAHGISTGPPLLTTTMVRGLAATTACTSSSWPVDRARFGLSRPSLWSSPSMTTATSDALAASTASCNAEPAPPGGIQPKLTDAPPVLS